MKKVIFIDRDGTLIVEPSQTKQVNSLKELEFIPRVISSLKQLYNAGYELTIITNQDGLGTPTNPRENYELINKKMLEVFLSEGIKFTNVFVCQHCDKDKCKCRKPEIGMIKNYLIENEIDKDNSYVVGDRKSDLEFAKTIGIKGFLLSKKQGWENIVNQILFPLRIAKIARKTTETDIILELNLDGSGKYNINTGLKFFDHLLEQFAKHSGFDLKIKCNGDLEIDEHHTIEDIAIALGSAFKQALSDKKGIERFAFERILVMDEAKTEVSLDLSGRAFLVFKAEFKREYVGDFPTEMLEHFLQSFCSEAGLNLNIIIEVEGRNAHHQIESCFKALGRCLRDAVKRTGTGISSTKGIL